MAACHFACADTSLSATLVPTLSWRLAPNVPPTIRDTDGCTGLPRIALIIKPLLSNNVAFIVKPSAYCGTLMLANFPIPRNALKQTNEKMPDPAGFSKRKCLSAFICNSHTCAANSGEHSPILRGWLQTSGCTTLLTCAQ